MVGGVGVANAVRAYLERKRGVIATFKSLGASGGFVFTVYLVQILIIAGDRHRHRAGARRADAVRGAAQRSPRSFRCRPQAASIPARWRWRRCSACWSRSPSRCCRSAAPATCRRRRCFARWVSRPARCRAGPMSMRRVGIAIAAGAARRSGSPATGASRRSSSARSSSPSSCCAASASSCSGWRKKSPRVRSTALRLAIGNIHRPGALTPSVVLSLGLGLTLLVTLALIDGNLQAADRRQPAGARAELLLRRHPEHRGRGFRRLHREGGADGQADARADAARPHHRAQRRRRAEGQGAAGRRLGAARRPRHHLCREAARERDARRRRVVAGGLFRRAAGLVLGRGGAARSA